ncbi:MAG: hypothetical protein VX642_13170 [Bdellovibrionota bacterium]|nr:hypothetical protein [Bdellovibrionota bacterium]
MKTNNVVRIGIYIGVIAVFAVAAQVKKASIMDSRQQVSVSIPNQVSEFGQPVDVEMMRRSQLADVHRVTLDLSSVKNKTAITYLSQKELDLVKVGQMIQHPHSEEIIGQLKSIASSPEISTALYPATIKFKEKIELDNPVVDIVVTNLKSTLSVPIEALNRSTGNNSVEVWVVGDDQKANPRKVSLGLHTAHRVEIKEGLSVGDKVVVNGYKYLSPNQKARVRNCEKCDLTNQEVAQ